MSEADLDKYRVSRLVPLMPDFYVGDPVALEKYVDGARKMQGMVGAFTSAFKKVDRRAVVDLFRVHRKACKAKKQSPEPRKIPPAASAAPPESAGVTRRVVFEGRRNF
ncbi:hypothetical protein EMIHUDRAFT_208486 [Emiliania huxleyi CCMP1516]|uniref:Uncharacterized protein n=2 Tax=Emiliania huxleyi TaxID=2903 RepID=A0A0D3JAM3_EMIH1|nr:hypothetical protein EMIHUDRAFT_208486 [Emiliania huxleyi CCMP1516]EOD20558.1 hypothetical protein EMIHUDRAFT_208486 [Emiliania huxleyi CCMP1516]|eukprot:XP_005772987.1 hypothetical protein EMIHUDRAFT_208486 [Emiliania huxleyi CCMP1516]